MKKLSIVIPLFNEEHVISALTERLEKIKCRLLKKFKWQEDEMEVIFVVDQPTDQTWPKLKHFCEQTQGYICFNLSQRVGQYISIRAGMSQSDSDALVVMDADLQDPPECIEKMYEQFLEGYDVVYGVRKSRDGESFFYKICCGGFYWLLDKLINIKVPKKSGEFRLMSKRAYKALLACKESNIFFRGLSTWIGFKQKAIYFDRASRLYGKTNYSFFRSFEYGLDGIFSFSSKPLRYISYFGFFIAVFGLIYAAYAAYLKLVLQQTGEGWASIIVILLILGGFQILSIGIIGEYIGRIYTEVKQRPLFSIQDIARKNNN